MDHDTVWCEVDGLQTPSFDGTTFRRLRVDHDSVWAKYHGLQRPPKRKTSARATPSSVMPIEQRTIGDRLIGRKGIVNAID